MQKQFINNKLLIQVVSFNQIQECSFTLIKLVMNNSPNLII